MLYGYLELDTHWPLQNVPDASFDTEHDVNCTFLLHWWPSRLYDMNSVHQQHHNIEVSLCNHLHAYTIWYMNPLFCTWVCWVSSGLLYLKPRHSSQRIFPCWSRQMIAVGVQYDMPTCSSNGKAPAVGHGTVLGFTRDVKGPPTN